MQSKLRDGLASVCSLFNGSSNCHELVIQRLILLFCIPGSINHGCIFDAAGVNVVCYHVLFAQCAIALSSSLGRPRVERWRQWF